jgi:protoheme IX farnesyltransferase
MLLPAIGCLIGTALSAAGANALNQWYERDRDARMLRTRSRPMPSGRLDPALALTSATAMAFSGVCVLLITTGAVPAMVSLFTILLYILLYTPMKAATPWATHVGAIPGALPPVIGWTAANPGDPVASLLAPGAWALFALMFFWQLPHFLAIAWMYREDYARGGYRVLPVLDADGARTSRQILVWTVLLVGVTTLPAWVGRGGVDWAYLAIALASGSAFLVLAARTARTREQRDARRTFIASVIHLPVLLMTLVGTTLIGTMF